MLKMWTSFVCILKIERIYIEHMFSVTWSVAIWEKGEFATSTHISPSKFHFFFSFYICLRWSALKRFCEKIKTKIKSASYIFTRKFYSLHIRKQSLIVDFDRITSSLNGIIATIIGREVLKLKFRQGNR